MGDVLDIFGSLEEKVDADKNASLHDADGVRMLSHIPHGIPTRQPMLDVCIGRDGLPVGRIVEFYGFERTGKTTAAYHVIASVQRRNGIALFIDTEMSFDKDRARECGCIINDTLKVVSAESIDAVIRTIQNFLDVLEEKKFTDDVVIVVDSITGVDTEFNLETEFGTRQRPGEDARTIKSGLRRIMPGLAKHNVSLIFINHAIATMASIGKQSRSAGGHAIKFWSSVRVEFKHFKDNKKGADREKQENQEIKITLEKLKGNKMGLISYKTTLLDEVGFDSVKQLLDACVATGIMKARPGKKYDMLNRDKEVIDTYTEDTWREWVASKGGFDVIYEWWFENAKFVGALTPWGESRFDEVEPENVIEDEDEEV